MQVGSLWFAQAEHTEGSNITRTGAKDRGVYLMTSEVVRLQEISIYAYVSKKRLCDIILLPSVDGTLSVVV